MDWQDDPVRLDGGNADKHLLLDNRFPSFFRSGDQRVAFERLSQRLLREAGFTSVQVTGQSGDGGIDGYGVLQINPFVSFKVLFQCKRYSNSVSPAHVRDFRGAMYGRADKGIIVTTGSFTAEAKKEAARDGTAYRTDRR